MKLRIAIVLAAVIGQLTHAASAAAQQDLQALLARPMSPGSVALLVEHVAEQAAQKRLIDAVKHEDPAVRAVAARIAFVTGSRGLAAGLITALAKEEHVPTAVEQVRALLGMLGQPGDSLVLRHVQRIGGPTARAMAESLARTRPADLVTHLPVLVAAVGEAETYTLGGPIATAAAQHPVSANDILQAVLATKNEKLWNSVLETTRYNSVPIPAALLMQALQSSDEIQRTGVVWHLFHIVDAGDQAPGDVLAAAAPKPASGREAEADLTWEDFGRELLARARGTTPAQADWAGLIALQKHRERLLPVSEDIQPYLTPDELKSLHSARGFERPATKRKRSVGNLRVSGDAQSRARVMRTIPVFAKGLLGDLLKVTGCKPPDESYAAVGEVTYLPAGGPQRIAVLQSPMSKACDGFVHSMMKLTVALAERPIRPEMPDRIVMLFNRQYLACADDPFPPTRPRIRPDSTIVPPDRKRAAKITYPDAAQRARIEGTVLLGVRLSYTGCIGAAETLRGADPMLDLAAIRGVFSAAYTPTLLDGQPVETIVTYTVNFDLR